MLDKLLQKIQRAPDFPAFSRTVQEIGELTADDDQRSINDLCALILRDVALTRKVLAVANTFSVREARGAVHTVSRAVMLLGFEEVKKLALALILFEHLQTTPEHAARLRDRMLQALFGGLLAQGLEQALAKGAGEQLFLVALFQHLGALLIYRHLPDAIPEIERLCAQEGLEEKTAMLRVTGIVPDHLGREMASRWGLPDALRASMRPLVTGVPPEPGQHLAWLASFANALVPVLLTARSAAQLGEALDERARLASIDIDVVRQALAEAREKMAVYARLIDAMGGGSAVFDRLVGGLPEESREDAPVPVEAAGAERLLRGIEDVTASMLGEYTLPQLLSSVVETLYQGLDLSLAAFFLLDVRARVLRPSIVYGAHSERVLKGGGVPLESGLAVALALLGKEDMTPRRPRDPSGRMAAWQWLDARADGAVILPLHVGPRPVGVFYAEGIMTHFTPEALQVAKTLRNQAALAVMNKTARG
ncbi:MAG: HDOD domain-containing protein [Pseudomonadota bacterium]